ncbi:uncharacterized protein T48 [Procambarus clarkii]|uniref:uncharacterized protein T48 n=1 Tax=Procambarus clarkii TaxID=6728 RepID=UPI001E675622|nr:uncharacterized protein LOC123745258 [Procambarus clarkii]
MACVSRGLLRTCLAEVKLLAPLIVLLLLVACAATVLASSGNNGTLQKSTCNQPDCLRCDLETAECVKCLYVMMVATRLCSSSCPPGHSTIWPPHPPLMGRICTERSMLALVSGRDLTIIAGAAVGGAVCVGVVIGALLYMRRRAKPPPDTPPPDHAHHHHHLPIPRLWRDKRPKTTEVSVADEERTEFLTQLRELRGEATNFLEMLTHTRNRFRTFQGPDSPTDTKAKAYRAVVRDLSRVLTLLNRREEHIVTVPGDWRRLLSWAARVLARYKRQKAARESGEMPSLETVPAGGTLYQTRRQAQAERCRLVAQGTPTVSASSSHPYHASRDSQQEQESLSLSYSDDLLSHMGSRTTSLMSLTPIILEENEDEDDGLFEDDVETHFEDFNFNTSMTSQYHSDVDFHVTNEEMLRRDEVNRENNNNTTTQMNHMNHFNNIQKDNSQTSPTIAEKIMNIKNMERLLEGSENGKHIISDVPRHHQHGTQRPPGKAYHSENPKNLEQVKNEQLQLLESDTINAVLSGEDMYINIVRKPVMVGLVLAGDPLRDDTLDHVENRRRGTQQIGSKNNTAVSCKAQARRHLPAPRCELTTEL